MHDLETYQNFPDGMDFEDSTIGKKVSLIHEVRNTAHPERSMRWLGSVVVK